MEKNKLQVVEEIVIIKYQNNGILTEDEIVDICIDNNLELIEIDVIYDRLLKRGIFNQNRVRFTNDDSTSLSDEDIVDRSQIDYDELLEKVAYEYPSMENMICIIKNIVPPQNKEWKMLIASAQNGDVSSKERMIYMYLRTVIKLAYDYATKYRLDFEEAFQYGTIGLITAIEKFDTTSPDLFGRYFPFWVRQSIQRSSSIEGTIFYYPAHYKDKMYQLSALIQWYCSVGCGENVEDILRYIELDELEQIETDEVELKKLISYIMPALKLDEKIASVDIIDECITKLTYDAVIGDMLSVLKDKSKEIIIMRFGLENGVAMTLEEVGNKIGVTRERIRQIEKRALEKMRVRLLKMKIKSINEVL